MQRAGVMGVEQWSSKMVPMRANGGMASNTAMVPTCGVLVLVMKASGRMDASRAKAPTPGPAVPTTQGNGSRAANTDMDAFSTQMAASLRASSRITKSMALGSIPLDRTTPNTLGTTLKIKCMAKVLRDGGNRLFPLSYVLRFCLKDWGVTPLLMALHMWATLKMISGTE